MKHLIGYPFDQWRIRTAEIADRYGSFGDGTCGAFNVPVVRARGAPCDVLQVIASCGEGWDHVSVSLPDRCPTWDEMVLVKRAFFEASEWAVEYHPPAQKNISVHDFCLHLWRPRVTGNDPGFPTPPRWMVG